MKKVLFVNHIAQITGAESSLLCLFRKLDRSKVMPFLACPGDGALARAAADLDVKVWEIPFRRLKGKFASTDVQQMFTNLPLILDRLCTIIREEDINILHANSTSAQLYCGPAANLTSTRVCWHLRRVTLQGEIHLQTAASFAAHKVVVVSEAVKKFALGFMPEDQIVKIYNGIDMDYWNPPQLAELASAFRREFNLSDTQPLVGMTSNFFPHKRQEDFIRAAAKILRRFPDARFVLLGDDLFNDNPEYKKMLTEIIKQLDLEDKLFFGGYRQDVRGALAAMDVFVLPSAHESFGRCAIEAMAMGKAVVAASADGPAEIIEDGWSGLLVAKSSQDKLADAIVRLLSDNDLRAEIGGAAKREVAARFDARRIAAQHELLYNSLT